MTYLLVATHVASVAIGYGACYLVDRHRQRIRARVLRALGGQLPDWERDARKIEEAARDATLQYQSSDRVKQLWEQADIIRKRGRRRDREWA